MSKLYVFDAAPLAAAAAAIMAFAGNVRADVPNSPAHPHTPSPVTTFAHDFLITGDPDPTHRHQHRTPHDPMAGLKIHGTGAGAEAYKANAPGQTWTGRTLVVAGGTHPGANTEAEHGHQGHEIDFGRYDVHPAVAGGDITQAEADAWNLNAGTISMFAFNAWNTAGNASGTKNWPGTTPLIQDNDEGPADPNGVPWHSSVDWRLVTSGAHEVHVAYGEAGGTAVGVTFIPPSGFPGGHQTQEQITMDDDQDWFYGTTGTPGAAQFDFATILLHESGHVVGLDHFGAGNLSYIMRPTFGVQEVTRVIDPDAVHGVRDLYAIPGEVPEPAGVLSLLTLVGLMCPRRRCAR